ncbi:YdiU family protein [Croceicoccus sp. F390]|uniref:Protein nucleotidyltransferase YdiU n=1 Tax=Croceicoccus esteveae TaxID=3075597 RepID=A0ABU2ZFF6_9SPHN|nr:YdiU family protein [Croceicoccus sp. F390]MDT0575330.1 YdiU family protein [Croceicoccus sp. F390]
MPGEPQQSSYHPETPMLAIADWLADPVAAAQFPQHRLRFRNDRAAGQTGLRTLDDEAWIEHFGQFRPLPGNLPQPLALRYHGHQFGSYNPDLGDGRGFLFAQLRADDGRLLDLGTKGSGQTPYSRQGDGRLTLKGAVREILATETLEALGVHTSRTLSVIETGEQLHRADEPSPARSAVLVRLSHGHIRVGSFQRLAAMGEDDHLRALVDYALVYYPGPPPPPDAPGRNQAPARLLHQVVERLADLAASYISAGFVHGVLNTDNMNISGESFDYGPWRFLPHWEPGFTAAYFDHHGLYAFGRQAEAIKWNCAQLAIALRRICPAEPLIAAVERYDALFTLALGRRYAWRLGLKVDDTAASLLVRQVEDALTSAGLQPDSFFHAARTGNLPQDGHCKTLAATLAASERAADDHPYWSGDTAQSMQIDEVEAIWSAIDREDDWTRLHDKIATIRNMGAAHGAPPLPAGHLPAAAQL